MPTVLIRFPARRYHATPWGHHVNEGLIEWPPSPWRLLRALLSSGYTTGFWNGDGPPSTACSLIEKLATVLPRYRLPPSCGAHSRHYMPMGRFKNGREDKTLVFDTWAQVDGGELAITWDVKLTEEETLLFGDLALRLGYLGRSESWVAARLADLDEELPGGHECLPGDKAPAPGPGWEQIPLIAAQAPQNYQQWRNSIVSAELAKLQNVDSTKKKFTKAELKIIKQRQFTEALYPLDLTACLQTTTNWLHEHGWSQPPGSRRVLYWRRTDALESGAPRVRHAWTSYSSVETMLLSMATPTRNDHALPSIVRTLPQAELLHRALVSVASRGSAHCEVLRGCDEMGKPLMGRHEHAHILPLDLDEDGHLDHFLIWAPMGLDQTAQAAVRSTRRTFTRKGLAPLTLALAGTGTLDELRSLPGRFGDGLRSVLGPPNGATEWISLTPFVPPRFLKARGRNTLEGQVIAELASRGLPAAAEIRLIEPREHPLMMRQRHFVRSRGHGPAPPIDCGFHVRLSFSEPLIGPLCLGYASHFGLGMFAAVV
ncbi:MAG: type I-U CRISPR-associated protein Csb2 [Syntrophobacteraceae bacterium]